MGRTGVGMTVLGLGGAFGGGFFAGWTGNVASRGGEIIVDLHVSGAQSISVFCDSTTVNSEGTDVTFVATEGACRVEAPLTASMPLKGDLHVSAGGRYACDRRNDELVCDRVR